MSAESTLRAEFPRALRGYAPEAVDRFVEEIGNRLDAMQKLLDEQAERTADLARATESAGAKLSAYVAKEEAIASALVSIEQHRASVAHENEQRAQEAHALAESVLEQARREATAIVVAARGEAAGLTAAAEAECVRQSERLESLRVEYEETIRHIRRALEAQLALLPRPGAATAELALTAAVAAPREGCVEAA
ncbi:MAG: DivIVA domain-containing protein [Chthonomonadales bacterium]|nr:DivIVA domain-containing protein [Chthonomonadales bacterium]